jgi:putative transposase
MPDQFKNKYRISSARLKTWDYSSCASYFVTICTKNKEHFFGEITGKQMQLNDIGKIAEQEWIKTPALRSDMNLELGEFVVMPNHFHGIMIIGANKYNTPPHGGRDTMRRVSSARVSNINNDPNMRDIPIGANKFGPQSKNLAAIIGGFKSSVTRWVKKSGNDVFGWQRLFHDHVINNTKSFEHIQDYILNNPSSWEKDKFYK